MYQRLGTFILSLLCSNMNCLLRHIWRVTVLCLPLFTYYLANHRMVSYLINRIFKLKEQTICVTVLRLPLFTYYLANHRMVSYLINSIFKLKEQTICNVYSIIPEAYNIQACKCLTVLWHTHGNTADMEEY